MLSPVFDRKASGAKDLNAQGHKSSCACFSMRNKKNREVPTGCTLQISTVEGNKADSHQLGAWADLGCFPLSCPCTNPGGGGLGEAREAEAA